ncbi:MAG: hypothetical protein R3320_02090 [Nitriliruptorales bacterium]|nr:hypothetical protein [Nitriliruptorales bacterium]
MASFAITHFFEGGTQEQYENTVKVVHPDGGTRLPQGQLYHAAGPTGDGWQIVATWDSEEAWEQFRDNKLLPGFEQVDNGLPAPPEETTFSIANEQSQ